MNDSLRRLADRAAVDPFFLAHALAEYASSEKLDESALAAALGTTVDVLPHLRLCRMPRTDAGFAEDVERIASRFGLNVAALIDVVRHCATISVIREKSLPVDAGYILAARDRPPS